MKTQPKIILSSLELEAFSMVLKASLSYYQKCIEIIKESKDEYITQISELNIKAIIIQKLYDDTVVNLKNPKYRYVYTLDLNHALQLLCSILPCENNQFNVKVKNDVLAHCVDVLKHHELISNNVCFRPPLPHLEPRPFFNPSTTLTDYFEN